MNQKDETTPKKPVKYYYISCNAEDAQRVSDVCREMNRMGAVMWHDNGSITGDEWVRHITERIDGCFEFILFLTKGLLARENRFVRNEFFFAKKSQKKMYAVALDPIQPEDISDSLKKWYSEINECCTVIDVPVGASPAEAAAAIEKAVGFAGDAEQKPETPENKADEKTSPEDINKEEVAKSDENKKPEKAKKPSSKKAAVICAVAAAAVVLAVLGIFLLPGMMMSTNPDYFSYDVQKDGVVITSLTNDELTTVRIPKKIEDKPVIAIGESAFSGCANLKKAVIPNSVKTIDSSAFLFCENLKEIEIPDSVTLIGEMAFSDCKSLGAVKLPSSVTEIGISAFQGCEGLHSVTIPDSVKTIGESAFMGCTSLKKVDIPDSVTQIGGSAFEGCTALTGVRLPSGLSEISYSVFEGCTELSEVSVPDSVKEIGDYSFSGCSELKKAVIPSSVENIVDSAFSDCPNLTVYGKSGSCAEEYAQAHSIPFKRQ